METLYKTLGLVRKGNQRGRGRTAVKRRTPTPTAIAANKGEEAQDPNKLSTGKKAYNTLIDVVTMVKRIQIGYTENNGTYLPGYLPTPGFIGTLRPTLGYTFGSQRDIRQLAAENGWLTDFQSFNQQYTEVENTTLDYSVNVEPMRDLKIDLIGNRTYAESFSENYRVDEDLNYIPLTPNTFGNFNISTILIGTAFSKSDENQSAAFDDFRANRLIVANRLARDFYGTNNFATDDEGYPLGFGKNSQRVLIPSFLSAYQGSDPGKVKTGAFRDFPLPNWTIKYTGLMKIPWFKKTFRRFSIQHGYRSRYTINQFRTNLDFTAPNTGQDYDNQPEAALDQSGNFKNATLYSNINLEEQFSPLVRLDFEMKNSIKVLAEIKTDRLLSLSFDNNLMTEIQGKEYILGLGYRIKDLRIRSKLAGPRQIIKSDLNMRADVSVRDNKTIIRYLDLENNQVTAGQTIWGLKYTADYAFSKNLSAIFYFDYTFSDFAISTSFPQTSLRSGITLRYNFGN